MNESADFVLLSDSVKRPLRWRWPALLLTPLLLMVAYWGSCPAQLMSGQYEGFIGGEYSNNKTHLILRFAQKGSQLRGDCLLSYQTGKVVVEHKGPLSGTVSGRHFKARGMLDNGQLVYLSGDYRLQQEGGQLQGGVYFEKGGRSSDSSPFLGRFKSAYSPRGLLFPDRP